MQIIHGDISNSTTIFDISNSFNDIRNSLSDMSNSISEICNAIADISNSLKRTIYSAVDCVVVLYDILKITFPSL